MLNVPGFKGNDVPRTTVGIEQCSMNMEDGGETLNI